jgi:hypothetical protein
VVAVSGPRAGAGSSPIAHIQSCFILRTKACYHSGDIVLIGTRTPVNRMPEGFVEDHSQVYVRVCGSSPISGGRKFRQAVQ